MTELLEVIFSDIIAGVVFAALGFGYLYLRFRSREIVLKKLASEYENSYGNAGRLVALRLVAGIGIALVLLLLGSLLIH